MLRSSLSVLASGLLGLRQTRLRRRRKKKKKPLASPPFFFFFRQDLSPRPLLVRQGAREARAALTSV
jgi:hypothetical protein